MVSSAKKLKVKNKTKAKNFFKKTKKLEYLLKKSYLVHF